ncbi:MAG: hypothetical protein WCF90_11065 [Methanomicrobiales archaeon]
MPECTGPALLRVDIIEYNLGVILELEGLVGEKRFRVTERPFENGLDQAGIDGIMEILYLLFRDVHRVDKRCRELPVKWGSQDPGIDKIRGHQPFHDYPHLTGRGPEVDR